MDFQLFKSSSSTNYKLEYSIKSSLKLFIKHYFLQRSILQPVSRP